MNILSGTRQADCQALSRRLRGWLLISVFGVIAVFHAGYSHSQVPAEIDLQTQSPQQPKNIVVMLSYDQALPWTREFISGLYAEKARHNQPVEFFFEFLDQRRLGDSVNAAYRADYLKTKFRGRRIDAVILESHRALRFIEQQGENAFGQVPYVVIYRGKLDLSGLERHALVNNENWLPGNAALIAQMHPGLKQLLVVGGSSPLARDIGQRMVTELDRTLPEVPVRTINNLSLPALKAELAQLKPGSLVLYTLYLSSPQGGHYIPRDVVADLAAAAPVPVYGLYDTYLGTGIVGGNMVSAHRAAGNSYRAAMRLLAGESNFSLEQPPVYADVQFDDRALRRFDIDQSRLPAQAQVSYRKPPFYEIYFFETASISTFVVVLLVALMIISRLYLQKRRLMSELCGNQQQLEQRVVQRTAELEQMATTDSLTGLYNRLRFCQLATEALQHSYQNGQPVAIAILDIDFFKQVNDSHGHASGDRALQVFAESAASAVRKQDLIGRIGGEEFALLLPDTGDEEAFAILERLRCRVADSDIRLDSGENIRITVSIGLVCEHKQAVDLESLLRQADRLLYRAKRSGKNRVCIGRYERAGETA